MKNINYKNKPLLIITLGSLLIIGMTGCRKLTNVEPPYNKITATNAFANDDNALTVINGIYTNMDILNKFSGSSSIGFYAALGADELTLYSGVSDPRLLAYYQNNLQSNASTNYGTDFWAPLYNYIYQSNNIIEQLNKSNGISSAVKKQLLGEAKFLRGFFYFYLVNLYGDVPLVKTTDYSINRSLGKSNVSDINDFIISDLKEADTLLSTDYLDGKLGKYQNVNTAERVRPTVWSAKALLARVCLYKKDYASAESYASQVISNNTLFNLTNLNQVFLKNNREAIWQVQTLSTYQNTADAVAYVLPSTGPTSYSASPAYLSTSLLSSFDLGDNRNSAWIGKVTTGAGNTYYFPYKYKNRSSTILEYTMVLRLAEQYLIRAEARAMQGNLSGAVMDLNIIRARARATPTVSIPDPLPDLPNSLTQQQIKNAVMKERRVELFTEWGHRWMDLKRTDSLNSIMTVVTPQKANSKPWRSFQALYPILFSDLQNNPNLTQNGGY